MKSSSEQDHIAVIKKCSHIALAKPLVRFCVALMDYLLGMVTTTFLAKSPRDLVLRQLKIYL